MNLAQHVSWEFYLDPPLKSVEKFHDLGERLMVELLKLEQCNDNVFDSAVSTDAEKGIITVELLVRGNDPFEILQKALDVTRTGIHAVGCGTPEWPTADILTSELLRMGGMKAENVQAAALV